MYMKWNCIPPLLMARACDGLTPSIFCAEEESCGPRGDFRGGEVDVVRARARESLSSLLQCAGRLCALDQGNFISTFWQHECTKHFRYSELQVLPISVLLCACQAKFPNSVISSFTNLFRTSGGLSLLHSLPHLSLDHRSACRSVSRCIIARQR